VILNLSCQGTYIRFKHVLSIRVKEHTFVSSGVICDNLEGSTENAPELEGPNKTRAEMYG